jgi:inositol-phosphate phosphatase / L-galactose 1-phosphate phosphatase / histidinol-phosphatase
MNESTIEEFGDYLAGLAMPLLSEGYGAMVRELRQDRELARVARQDGIDALVASDNPSLSHLRKANRELVTGAERKAELAMRQAVEDRFPRQGVVGEEHGHREGSDGHWVFDPVDGTSAMIRTAMAQAFELSLPEPVPAFGLTIGFVSGQRPEFSTIVELRPDGESLASPNIWRGWQGQQPTCNGERVSPPDEAGTLAAARLACTVPKVMFDTPKRWRRFQALQDATATCVTDQNCIGFMRLLADGDAHIDVVYEADMAYHDVAALIPILEGLGAIVTDDDGNDLVFGVSMWSKEYRVLAASPSLYQLALDKLRSGDLPAEGQSESFEPSIDQGYVKKFAIRSGEDE